MTKLSILSAASLAAATCLVSTSAAFAPVWSSQHHQVVSSPMTAASALKAMYNRDQEVVGNSIVGSSTLPGNLGFDPLKLAQTKRQLVTYRQAEIKHGRLAMLAVSAIMWSDLNVVDTIGATPLVEGRAFPEFLGACVGFPAALELYGEKIEEQHAKYVNDDDNDNGDEDYDDPSYFPGNLELDPFHLYPGETRQQYRVQMVEIMTGRLCMLAAAMRLAQNGLEWIGVGDDDFSSSLVSLWMMPSSVVETTDTGVVV